MAGLCWMTLTLALLLSAGSSLAVDQNRLETLERLVTEILNRYTPTYTDSEGKRRSPMFSVAVSVPYNEQRKMYDMNNVPDMAEEVRETILKCEVYSGTKVVAATVLRFPNVLEQCPNEPVPWRDVLRAYGRTSMTWADVTKPYQVRDGRADHAEYRTLTDFDTLLKNHDKNDFLIFYVLSSPCDKRCTNKKNRFNILEKINRVLNWNKYAIVFSNVFQPRSGDVIGETPLQDSLKRLGEYSTWRGSVGLENIFRCTKQDKVRCTSCESDGGVTPYCYSNNVQRPVVQPQPGTSYSPSRRSNSPQPGPSTNINTGRDEGGSGGGTGGKRKRKRRRGRKKQSAKTEDNVPASQNDLENPDTNAGGDAGGRRGRPRKASIVGGRRVGRKKRGRGSNQKKRTNKRKKTGGASQGRWEDQGDANERYGGRQTGGEPRNRKKMWMNGETSRVNQPRRGRRKGRRRG